MQYTIPLTEMRIDLNSNTIWIDSPLGATVLRIKCWSGIDLSFCKDNPVTHADINLGLPVGGEAARTRRLNLCLGPDAVRS